MITATLLIRLVIDLGLVSPFHCYQLSSRLWRMTKRTLFSNTLAYTALVKRCWLGINYAYYYCTSKAIAITDHRILFTAVALTIIDKYSFFACVYHAVIVHCVVADGKRKTLLHLSYW